MTMLVRHRPSLRGVHPDPLRLELRQHPGLRLDRIETHSRGGRVGGEAIGS